MEDRIRDEIAILNDGINSNEKLILDFKKSISNIDKQYKYFEKNVDEFIENNKEKSDIDAFDFLNEKRKLNSEQLIQSYFDSNNLIKQIVKKYRELISNYNSTNSLFTSNKSIIKQQIINQIQNDLQDINSKLSNQNDLIQSLKKNLDKKYKKIEKKLYELYSFVSDRNEELTFSISMKLKNVDDDLIKLKEEIKSFQTNQLTIFSIFMTILTFVGINIKEQLPNDYKQVLLSNLSFLFVATVLFSYIIMMRRSYKHDTSSMKKVKVIGILIIPFIVAIAIIILGIFLL